MEDDSKKIINVYKRIGETPLQTIERMRKTLSIEEELSITYAGRLDPMADGVLLLLIGDAVHKKDEMLNLEKEYVFSILFGFSTDSFDMLGKITDVGDVDITQEKLQEVLRGFNGEITQSYPPYSSKTVKGKPLFQWAREDKLSEIEIPKHTVTISDLWLKDFDSVSGMELLSGVERRIDLVQGDFRQEEIQEMWQSVIDQERSYVKAVLHMSCSSGTYVRQLATDIGNKLNTPTTTLSITRERVGEYSLESSVR